MLAIDSATLNFGDKDILSGCYLAGEKGEVIGLLGRNGSGKSCLLKIIFGTQKASHKHLRIQDKIIDKAYLTKQVCYLPQESFLPPFLRVDTLLKSQKKEMEDSELSAFLLKHGSSRLGELSGGELRIVECLWILQQPAD